MSELFKNAKHVQFFPCRGLGFIVEKDGSFGGIVNIRYRAVIVNSDGSLVERGYNRDYEIKDLGKKCNEDIIVVNSVYTEADVDDLIDIAIKSGEYEDEDDAASFVIYRLLSAIDVKKSRKVMAYIEELKITHGYSDCFNDDIEYDCW